MSDRSNKETEQPNVVMRVNRRPSYNEPDEPKPWWKNTTRRNFVIAAGIGAVGIAGVATWWALSDDSNDINEDSLQLQRQHGWNLGSEDKKLNLINTQTVDSTSSDSWKKYLDQSAMLTAYQPQSGAWLPYFVPTLIQSLQFESLRNQLAPIYTPGMKESYERGQAIAKEFLTKAQNAAETAIIVDLVGNNAVAFGAGLADVGHLIPLFDNFPHPLGVTPSHEVLAAMLYYANEVETKRATVPASAPPVFLLDSSRLANYKDEETQFDNRYLAKLPSAQSFKERGVKSIIYITPDRTRQEELDDLNEDFVDYKSQNLNVALLPLSDFTAVDETVARKQADGNTTNEVVRHYYYGGSPLSHGFFFYSYPFYSVYPVYVPRYTYLGGRAPVSVPVTPPRYVPVQRPTMFSGSRIGKGAVGVGRSKPSGFGRSTVRVSGPRVIGTRAGRSGYYSPSSRSGSFGRGGFFGG
ncbi:MAG: hypothetical protein AB1489_02655 [Acidobacteriota bacterium]